MIHYFNPGHETAVLNQSPYYTPPTNIFAMQNELALLPAWYAQRGDCVWIDTNFDKNHILNIQKLVDFNIEIVNESNIKQFSEKNVQPWGLSPQIIRFFEEINSMHSTNLTIPKWDDKLIELNSRYAAKECLKQIIERNSQISPNLLPSFYSSLDEIEHVANNSPTRLLAKAPYSSSGRGLLWLPTGGLTRTERQILHGMIKKQGKISIENVLDKQLDFAMEFMSDANGEIKFEGYSLFTTNNKGGYMGNMLTSQKNIETLIAQYISSDLLLDIQKTLCQYLSTNYATKYKGCIGVDMMIYKNEQDEYKLQPCVEINMRYNMGYLSLKFFENYVAPQSEGKFLIEFSSQVGEIVKKHIQYSSNYPIVCNHGQITKGYLNLCPVNENSKYWAYIVLD